MIQMRIKYQNVLYIILAITLIKNWKMSRKLQNFCRLKDLSMESFIINFQTYEYNTYLLFVE